MYIKAPFNFVPLSDKVYTPDWANQISHDIPFEDGLSGIIDLKITAKTPVFVRNGHTPKDAEEKSDGYKSFSKVDDKYFIPATSIKGMLRTVLEIISFGKMPVDKRKRYSVRDWYNDQLNLKSSQNEIYCGWLFNKDGNIFISNCGKPLRINHKRIDEFLNFKRGFEHHFKRGSKFNLNKPQKLKDKSYDPKTACFKYALLNNLSDLENKSFEEDAEYNNERQTNRVRVATNGNLTGTIVFTGQPSPWVFPRKPGGGKFYEFVFENRNELDEIPVDSKYFEQVSFFYKESDDWKFWIKKFNSGGKIPVFFRFSGKEEDKQILDFGLAFLYKVPYKNSIEDIVSEFYKNKKELDLAECVFGYTSNNNSLKARVQIGHAFIDGEAKECEEATTTLGSPKASYYPIYIQQEGTNGRLTNNYKTYNDGIISGWKRYPIQNNAYPKPTNNENLDTKYIPLAANKSFKCKIRYHNLKPIELGALFSALTFHGNAGYYHNIGMAKPLGYGKIKIEVMSPENFNSPLCIFEETMNLHLNGDDAWRKSPQIMELYAMAKEIEEKEYIDNLSYMALDMANNINEFNLAKRNKEYLQPYSELTKYNAIISSPLAQEKIVREEKEKRLKKEEEINLKKQRERELQLKKEKEREEIEARRIEILDAGLTFLENMDNFDKAKRQIDQYLKKAKNDKIPEEHHDMLFEFISKLFKESKPRDKKDFEKEFEKSASWKKISNWIGYEKALLWYNKIIKG